MCTSPCRSSSVTSARQHARLGGVDLAAGLAQRRIDAAAGRAPRRCRPRSRRRCGRRWRRRRGRTRSACSRATGRAVAQRDVVRLRAGEVLQRRAARLGRHQPQVGLHAGSSAGCWPWCRRGRGRARPAGSAVKRSEDVGRARRWPGCRCRRWSRRRGAGCRRCRRSASGAASRSQRDQRLGRLAGVGRSGDGRRACARSAIAVRIRPSFFAPMPLMPRMRAGLGGRFEVVERADVQRRGRAAPRSSARCPAGASPRGSRRGTAAAARRAGRWCRWRRCRGCAAARSLPMPSMASSAGDVEVGDASGESATTCAPVR